MRKLFIVLAVLLNAALVVQAQSPEKMSYQAVIRNSSSALVANTQIGMEINIRQGSPTGAIVYTETLTPSSNASGLVSIEIGGGAGFSSINWGSDDFYIEIKTAIVAPLTTYTNISTSQLLSVPYALHAKTADTIIGGIAETDPIYSSSQAANITTTDITKLSNLSGTNTGDQDLSNLASKSALADSIALVRSQIPDVSGYATTSVVATGLASKVDKETNKGLSTNDYTNTEKTKLEGIATGAEVNVNADWNATTGDAQVLNKPDLSVYATTTTVNADLSNKVDKETGKVLSANDYTDAEKTKLGGIATGAEVNVNADWNATTGDAQVLNKPDLGVYATTTTVNTGLSNKVDKEAGKSLSTNDYTTTEKTKLSGIATGAEVNVNADWNALSGDAQILNKPVIPASDGSETKITAGSNITVSGSGTGSNPYIIKTAESLTQTQRDALTPLEGMIVYNSTTKKPNYYNGTEWMNYDGTSAKTFSIGIPYQGGIVAYIFQVGEPGYVAGQTHGLIVATVDQGTSNAWYNGSYETTGATGTAIGTGSANTAAIVATQGVTGTYAALLCKDYNGGGYSDWYLPSKDELNKLYVNRLAIGGLTIAYYWSSSETTVNNAWECNFDGGPQMALNKNYSFRVRAVRTF